MKAASLLEGGEQRYMKTINQICNQNMRFLISTKVDPENKYSYTEMYKGQLYLYHCYEAGAARQRFRLNVRVIKVSAYNERHSMCQSHSARSRPIIVGTKKTLSE